MLWKEIGVYNDMLKCVYIKDVCIWEGENRLSLILLSDDKPYKTLFKV